MRLFAIAALCGLAVASAAPPETASERKDAQTESESSEAKSATEDDEETVRTPFGYVKKRKVDKPASPAKPSKPLVDVNVVGDTVKFKRKTPFGVQAWTRLKSELSDDERKLAEQAGVDLDGGSTSVAKPAAAPRGEPVQP